MMGMDYREGPADTGAVPPNEGGHEPHVPFVCREARLIAAFVALAAVLLAVARLGFEIREDGTSGFDRWLMLALRRPGDLAQPVGPAWLKAAAIDVTALGGVTVLTLVTVLAVGYLLASRKWLTAGLLTAATVSGRILGSVLKAGFGRARPDIVPHLVDVHSLSYPSGHATNSAIVFLTLGALLARAQDMRRTRIYVMAAGVLLTVLVGCSRVLVGVHWPTDVLAGWAVGGSWAMLWWAMTMRVDKSRTAVGEPAQRLSSGKGGDETT